MSTNTGTESFSSLEDDASSHISHTSEKLECSPTDEFLIHKVSSINLNDYALLKDENVALKSELDDLKFNFERKVIHLETQTHKMTCSLEFKENEN